MSATDKRTVSLPADEVHAAFDRIVDGITDHCRDVEPLVVCGIAKGGITFGRRLAERLTKCLGRPVEFGILDISFHRDDLSTKPFKTVPFPTDLPFGIDDATVILADDVMASGRSARAALSELFDQGRPAKVLLAILCDRGNRSLPFQPDFLGMSLVTASEQRVKVNLHDDEPERDHIYVG